MRGILIALVLAALALSAGAATAQKIRFAYSALLTFRPDAVVGRNGGTARALWREIIGADAKDGAFTVTGTLTYERATPRSVRSHGSDSYANAIHGMSVKLGGLVLKFDPSFTWRNRATSKVGQTARPDMGFCPNAEMCAEMGVPMTPTGNVIQVINDSEHNVRDETGLDSYAPSDVLAFLVGRTAAAGEFKPAITTPGFGTVSIDGAVLGLFSRRPGRMLASAAIPDIASVAGSPEIERTEFWLYLEGPALRATIRIEGVVKRITPLP